MDYLNEVAATPVLGVEIGKNKFREITRLRQHVYGDVAPKGTDRRLRFAPSIITRSEAELFGLSMPRFALRLYLDEGRRAFVNIRRLATLQAIGPQWGARMAREGRRLADVHPMSEPQPTPAEVLQDCSCIADCVLPIDKNRFRDYQVLQANLGLIYGEALGDKADYLALPFVKHMHLSGGLCAQAVCFMATLLLHRYANGVHGVADVTALANGEDLDELRLTGLGISNIINYFRHADVGLGAACQVAYTSGGGSEPLAKRLDRALQAYVSSGMPVILTVDMVRMAGCGDGQKRSQSIYTRNGVKYDPPSKKTLRHAILVVGCDKEKTGEYLVNDTAQLPVMKASAEQLRDARCYCSAAAGRAGSLFLPVTPAAVCLPFEDSQPPDVRPGERRPWRPGVLRIARHYQLFTPYFRNCFRAKWADGRGPGTFNLATAGSAVKGLPVPAAARDALKRLLRKTVRRAEWDRRWYWFQQISVLAANDVETECIYVWDAGVEPPANVLSLDAMDLGEYLLGILWRKDGKWRYFWSNKRLRPPLPPVNLPERRAKALPLGPRPLNPSVITSFSVLDGFRGALTRLPHAAYELYAFMGTDNAVVPGMPAWPSLPLGRTGHRPAPPAARAATVVDWLAAIAGSKTALAAVSASLRANLPLKPKQGVSCIGLATFIPEIGSGGPQAEKAEGALRALIALAGDLRARGHHLSAIEIVAGSAIRGLWPATEQGRQLYVANRPKTLARLFGSLLYVLDRVALEAQEAGVCFSIEMEPGPLYLLRDETTILDLCEALDDSARLSPVVGLNLDIAHWSLANIPPSFLDRHPDVANRIVHVHVSSHCAGHFGDLCLGEAKRSDLLLEWLGAAQRIALAAESRGKGLPKFSGRASVEIEACKCGNMARFSWLRLNHLLAAAARGDRGPVKWPANLESVRHALPNRCGSCPGPCK